MEVFVKGKSDYAPEYSSLRFSGDSTKTLSGDSEDMDFNDVLGGPPKRFSMQEVRVRYSFGDSEDDKASSPWIALKEKPVFGEGSSTRRRRQGGDFFDDIFRVDESHSSPRRTNNLIGSNPGSRIMSPARPLPPTAEPFGTSLPAQFSLPAKSTKFPDYPTFASPNNIDVATNGLNSSHSSSASLSRFSNQANLGHEDIKNEVLPVYRQSPLSRQGSGMDTKSVDINSNQFHFSIYKWAGKGVPMLIPLVGRNNLKTKNISRNELSKNLEPESLKTEREENDSRGREVKSQENENASVVLEAAKLNVKIERVKSVDEIGMMKKSENEVSPKMEKSNTDEAHQPGNVTEMKENKSRNPKNARKNAKKNEGARIESSRDNKLPEYSLQGNVTEVKEHKSISPEMMKNATKSEGARIDSNRENLVHDKRRVTGKVKDFVQIFNQEADSGPKADFQTRNSSSRWKSVKIDQKQNEVDKNLNKDETQQSTSTKTSYQSNEHFTTKSACSSESIKRDSKISAENSDDPFEDNFLVQELSGDLEKAIQSDKVSVDMKEITDAKIRQWSFGRKGNIRSLLSTLQLVLWPESGWKPVPLMDLIEANSVKRAYQKALLRLHPDKLQQKGADSHHKYIAEKVFDILQEAWDHFNTLAPI